MKSKILVLLLSTGLFSGCSIYQINSKDTTQEFYPPKHSIEDVTYLEKIDKPYEEIGTVTVTTERFHSIDDVLPALKQEAAILGGDAITDIQTDAAGSWKKIKPPFSKLLGNAYIRANYTAKVVVLK